ncbi:hypothetical protein [Actinoplanes sp. G11-F43]|uniref:hypothetical protein n=1 Tax=Actinoplanes sp. G11-F43 TaxID=3424130 RepID=UPI003D356B2C
MAAARGCRCPLAFLTLVSAGAVGGLAAIGWMVWSAHRAGDPELTEGASYGPLGVSAAAGVAVLLGAAAALVRGARGLPLDRLLSVSSWVRLAMDLVSATGGGGLGSR